MDGHGIQQKFQYLMVQLKGGYEWFWEDDNEISIPHGTIKSRL